LPTELIAQTPAPQRDLSRLLVLNRKTKEILHRKFSDILEFLQPGDVLVLNNSKVIPARLRAVNEATGGRFEVVLLRENAVNDWWAMLRPAKRARVGSKLVFRDLKGNLSRLQANVLEKNEDGHRRLRFEGTPNLLDALASFGEIPLPPYVKREDNLWMEEDRQRYQTIFAVPPGSVAAPTAGLHFTEELLKKISARNIQVCFVTLHVGPGTFAPIKAETVERHTMHEEYFDLAPETAGLINQAMRENRRIVAVGTTSVRVLESAAIAHKKIRAGKGQTKIFIYPPYDFKIVNALVTNFHLPQSTLLMLVSAFAAPNEIRGREMMLAAYTEAIQHRYRFFSYGDAMLIL
jgi:S-adenosylmethionine:tRNA ribosyltransferase-isomerase